MPVIQPSVVTTSPLVQNITGSAVTNSSFPVSSVNSSSAMLSTTPSGVSDQQSTNATTLESSTFLTTLGITSSNSSTITANSTEQQTTENSVTTQATIITTESPVEDSYLSPGVEYSQQSEACPTKTHHLVSIREKATLILKGECKTSDRTDRSDEIIHFTMLGENHDITTNNKGPCHDPFYKGTDLGDGLTNHYRDIKARGKTKHIIQNNNNGTKTVYVTRECSTQNKVQALTVDPQGTTSVITKDGDLCDESGFLTTCNDKTQYVVLKDNESGSDRTGNMVTHLGMGYDTDTSLINKNLKPLFKYQKPSNLSATHCHVKLTGEEIIPSFGVPVSLSYWRSPIADSLSTFKASGELGSHNVILTEYKSGDGIKRAGANKQTSGELDRFSITNMTTIKDCVALDAIIGQECDPNRVQWQKITTKV